MQLRLLAGIDVLDAVALVLESAAISADLRLPSTVFALILVGGHVAADAISTRRWRDKPRFVGDIRSNSRASSAWITRSGWSARAIPPIASAVDIERRKCRAECRIDGDPELGRGQIEVVSINERRSEGRTFFTFEPACNCSPCR